MHQNSYLLLIARIFDKNDYLQQPIPLRRKSLCPPPTFGLGKPAILLSLYFFKGFVVLLTSFNFNKRILLLSKERLIFNVLCWLWVWCSVAAVWTMLWGYMDQFYHGDNNSLFLSRVIVQWKRVCRDAVST